MKFQLIRNATMKIEYSTRTILTDPFLGGKFAYESFVGKSRNPTVDLPCSPAEVVKGVDLCIVSHLHPDHFDAAAVELMNKDIDILCQPGDDHFIKSAGFINVDAINESTKRNGIEIIRTAGLHGGGMWSEQMGRVSGFILKSEDEPTVYWSGDTVWYEEVNRIIQQFNPRIIITHSGGASFVKGEPIIMDEVQTLEVCRSAPNSIVIAVHLESLDHLTVTRSRLREYANANGIGPDKLLIPKDGDVVEIENS